MTSIWGSLGWWSPLQYMCRNGTQRSATAAGRYVSSLDSVDIQSTYVECLFICRATEERIFSKSRRSDLKMLRPLLGQSLTLIQKITLLPRGNQREHHIRLGFERWYECLVLMKSASRYFLFFLCVLFHECCTPFLEPSLWVTVDAQSKKTYQLSSIVWSVILELCRTPTSVKGRRVYLLS